MPNALQNYLENSDVALVTNWTPAASPSLMAQFGGFQLGVNAPATQLPAGAFMASNMITAWSAISNTWQETPIKDALIGAINGIAQGFDLGSAALDGSISNVLSGVMEGVGSAFVYVEAMNDLAAATVRFIEGQRTNNDQARYEKRLECVEALKLAGPRAWGGANYWTARYIRERAGQSNVSNMAWPPDLNTRFTTPPKFKRRGDCSQGGSELAPKGGSCKGSFSLFPIYMPLWGNRALGSPGVVWSMKAGMERATYGGAKIWRLLSEMQGSLLMDPMLNLLCDSRPIYWRMQNFIQSQWAPLLARALNRTDASPTTGIPYGISIDAEFDENNNGKGYYYTPGHMIGAYTNTGHGSLSHESLERNLRSQSDEEAGRTSSFGGNGIRISDYNTVISTTAQFLSLRTATLRNRAFCQRAVDEGLLSLIPEPALRLAVQSSAAGQPATPIGDLSGLASASFGRDPGRPAKHSRPAGGGGGGGGAVFAGLLLASMAIRKR